jgi:hypothetical protein
MFQKIATLRPAVIFPHRPLSGHHQQVVRNLLSLAGGDDAARLTVLRELAGLLAGAATSVAAAGAGGDVRRPAGGGYPSLEMDAHISTTWNRGAHHARFGRQVRRHARRWAGRTAAIQSRWDGVPAQCLLSVRAHVLGGALLSL